MPPTTIYDFGDVVLVPFPFTDLSGVQKRPAVVVSSPVYNSVRPDVVVVSVTSQASSSGFGEVPVTEWKKAGLVKPSVIKPVLATLEKAAILRRLGQLEAVDRVALSRELARILGSAAGKP